MQFAVLEWVGSNDSAKAGTIFGIVDKANPGALPSLSPNGYWADFWSIDEKRFNSLRMQKRQPCSMGIICWEPASQFLRRSGRRLRRIRVLSEIVGGRASLP